jgi:hypothetical protein
MQDRMKEENLCVCVCVLLYQKPEFYYVTFHFKILLNF